jgi:hypothetical protein
VGRYLALQAGPGLADVLAGRASVPEVLRDSLDGRLTVMPCGTGPADPGELLASPRLGAALDALTETFDVVLVDAPPLRGVADPVVLSRVTDASLLVVRANHTPAAEVARSRALLEKVGARLAGGVLNALPRKLPAGTSLHRPPSMPAGDDLGLVTGEAHETIVIVPSEPVRATAPVIRGTPGRAQVFHAQPRDEPPRDDEPTGDE